MLTYRLHKFFVSDLSNNLTEELNIQANDDKSFYFKKKWNYVFCYGKEVNDFHILDKQKLFTLNFSATQEIDKIQQEEKTKLVAAEAKIAALEDENVALKARLDAIEARLNAGGL